VQLAGEDARELGILEGDTVTVRSNGTAVELRAHISRELRKGVVQIADLHAGELQTSVEVTK
jgi:anaerobic selenocysteine-containing dehydrogenase